MERATSTAVAATGTAHSGPGSLFGARLVAGADAATAILRDGGASGAVIAKLSAPAANNADELRPSAPIAFHTDLHVTLTGTSPQFNVFI